MKRCAVLCVVAIVGLCWGARLWSQVPLPGLASGDATCVLQDRYGFLWFGTENGLHRWDGVKMRVFVRKVSDTTSLPSSVITHLHEDKRGTLWIATNAGLVRFNRHNETFSRVMGGTPDTPDTPIASLWEDRRGGLWVYAQVAGSPTGKVLLLENGAVVPFVSSGLASLSRATASRTPLQNVFVTAFCEAGGVVWIGTANGLYRYSPEQRTVSSMLVDTSVQSSLAAQPRSRINALAAVDMHAANAATPQKEALVVATSGGLLVINADGATDGATDTPRPIYDATLLPFDATVAALQTVRIGGIRKIVAAVVVKQPAKQQPTQASPRPSSDATSNAALAVRMRFVVLEQAHSEIVPIGVNVVGVGAASDHTLPVVPQAGKPQQHRMMADSAGTCWWAVANGVVRITVPANVSANASAATATLLFADKTSPSRITAPFMQGVIDHTGTRWWARLGVGVLSEQAAGLSYPNATPFQTTFLPFASLAADREGALYFGADGAAVSLKRSAQGNETRLRHTLPDARVSAILINGRGTVFAASNVVEQGVVEPSGVRVSGATQALRRLASNADERLAPTALAETPDGTLWVGTAFGLYKRTVEGGVESSLQRVAVVKHRSQTAQSYAVGSGNIHALVTDGQGMLWVGHDQGIDRYNPKTRLFTHLYADAQDSTRLVDDDCVCLAPSNDGTTLWIGTRGGLHRMDIATGKVLGRYVLGSSINACVEDARGTLWAGTSLGLVALEAASGRTRLYTQLDGIPLNEYLERAALRLPDGRVVFGGRTDGRTGVVVVHPDSIAVNRVPPNLVLTAIKRFGVPMSFDRPVAEVKSVTFGHDETVIAFDVVALNFVQSAKNRYAYRLEGFDQSWSERSAEREIRYTNLPAGEYVLHVKASNNDGVWNEKGVRLRVVVLPTWWATWWFQAGVVITAMGGGWTGYRLRTKALERRNQELERVVEERTRALKEAQAQLVQSERLNAAGMVTAGVMHEINNPNAALLSAAQMAMTDVNDAEEYFLSLIDHQDLQSPTVQRFQGIISDVRQDLAIIENSSRRIKHIVTGLQGFTKHQREGLSASKVAKEIASTIEIVHYQFKTTEFVQTIDEHLMLEAYWQELNQAILNLLVNAAQAGANRVEVCAEERGKHVVVSVSDNGCGMTSEVQAKVFEPFFTTKDVGNSGLGLSITKNIVEHHGATIELESQPGLGSTFRITFS